MAQCSGKLPPASEMLGSASASNSIFTSRTEPGTTSRGRSESATMSDSDSRPPSYTLANGSGVAGEARCDSNLRVNASARFWLGHRKANLSTESPSADAASTSAPEDNSEAAIWWGGEA